MALLTFEIIGHRPRRPRIHRQYPPGRRLFVADPLDPLNLLQGTEVDQIVFKLTGVLSRRIEPVIFPGRRRRNTYWTPPEGAESCGIIIGVVLDRAPPTAASIGRPET